MVSVMRLQLLYTRTQVGLGERMRASTLTRIVRASFCAALELKLKPGTYPRGALVIQKGDVGGAMYFVSRCGVHIHSAHTEIDLIVATAALSLSLPCFLLMPLSMCSGNAEVVSEDHTVVYATKTEGAALTRCTLIFSFIIMCATRFHRLHQIYNGLYCLLRRNRQYNLLLV